MQEAALAQRRTRAALRQARAGTDLTWYDVTRLLEWPLSKILRIEQGHWPVDQADHDRLVELYAAHPKGRSDS